MNAQAENTERPHVRVNTDETMTVEFSQPGAIPITATNSLTGEVKHYMLRVTSKGGLCLV